MNCKDCPFLNVDHIIKSTVKRTIEETGLISKYINRTEALKECSLTRLMNAEKRGNLTKIKNGSLNSKVKYLRAEFENWNRKKNIE